MYKPKKKARTGDNCVINEVVGPRQTHTLQNSVVGKWLYDECPFEKNI